MNVQEFLASGLLELYVAGQCSPAERAEVERMALLHPEIKAELEAIEITLEQFAQAQAIAPPAALRQQIMDNIAHDAAKGTGAAKTLPSNALRFFQMTVAALALLAAWLFYQNNTAQKENETLSQDVAQLNQQLRDCAKKQENNKAIVATLRDADTKRIKMGDEKAYTYVFHNLLRRETVLDLSGVQAPTPGKYLQAWAIVGGQPVSMGMVEWSVGNGLQSVPFMEKAEAFALSEEDNPKGNATPTVVVMVGKV